MQPKKHYQKPKIAWLNNLIPYTKISQKWIIDLNINYKIIKLLKENMGPPEFLEMIRKAPSIKEKKKNLRNWTSVKLKSLTLCKTLLGEWKDKLQSGGKYLQATYLIKNSYLDYIKESQNSTLKKTRNRQKTWGDISPKIYTWNIHMK